MQFLYPDSEQFPFDRVCREIVFALEERNWQVPGITVDFRTYGSGEEQYRMVDHIKGRNFKLWFCRVQKLMPGGRYNDTAGVTQLNIPRKQLEVYEDESGPTFYRYIGQDWKADRESFMNDSKVNSKLRGKPKTYLEYKGACACSGVGGAAFEAIGLMTALLARDKGKLARMKHTHPGRRPPLLVHTNDLEREYDATSSEPKVLTTKAVMKGFARYLEKKVLRYILGHPVSSAPVDAFPEPAAIPMPDSIGPIFCFGEYRDAERIRQGQFDKDALPTCSRYGMSHGGYRLLALDVNNDGTVPEIAYEGFLWCGIGDPQQDTPIASLEVPGHYRWPDREQFVIRIMPDRANGIYIADHAAYEKRRKELAVTLGDRDRFTDDEVNDFIRARGRTIVPIAEYRGGFEQPSVLVGRELGLHEVEVVSGPHEERRRRFG